MNCLVGKVASYDGATLKVTEQSSMAHSSTSGCLWRLQGCVLDFLHLSAMDVAEIVKCTIQKGYPHTFGHVVYVCMMSGHFE